MFSDFIPIALYASFRQKQATVLSGPETWGVHAVSLFFSEAPKHN